MSNQEKLNDIGRLLGERPTVSSWEAIMDIVIESESEDQEYLVNAILDIPELKKWDPRYRVCPEGWWEEILESNQLPIWWPLIQHLDYTTYEGDIGPVEFLKGILSLNIVEGELVTMQGLENLSQLLHFVFHDFDINMPCSEIGTLVNLNTLVLSIREIRDISFLNSLKMLESIDLNSCEELEDITVLGNLKNLRKISLWGCHSVEDVSVLKMLPNLAFLDLRDTNVDSETITLSKDIDIIF